MAGSMPHKRKPSWIRVKLPSGAKYRNVNGIVNRHNLHTICQSGNCPNMGECWSEGTATFMILGNICTRSCKFCAVQTGRPLPPDPSEPERLARSVKLMGVKHCVITSVDRDDLADGGASVWAKAIGKVREVAPETTMETLIPDFKLNTTSLDIIIEAAPDIVSHNLETVERLTSQVRIQAKYRRSLGVLSYLSEKGMRTKSGIMLGLGEHYDEILDAFSDIFQTGCRILTVGQYLQPTRSHLPVHSFVTPEVFAALKKEALKMGFTYVESGPLVRSSYHAERHL